MALFIEILDGNELGQKFRVVAGVRLGRTTGEIQIRDPKISALHAQVEKDNKGQLILVDKGSSNGLRINGKRVPRVLLMPGVKFRVGRTNFKVVEFQVEEHLSPDTDGLEGWRKILKHQVPQIVLQNRTSKTKVLPFSPIVELTFIQGIQSDQKILLGYGPRRAGSDVLDIELEEESAPDVAFELIPDRDGVRFRTLHPKLVQLNGQSISSDILKAGDQISIGSSLIEVNFLT
jgi:pSer/pThr/pTyr-binding forkhead associated (FHA) protein